MHEAAERWATEQFPPDQRENLAGNTIWHWMVEGYRAGLAASPSEEKYALLIELAEGIADGADTVDEWRAFRAALAALRPTRVIREVTLEGVTLNGGAAFSEPVRAALRTTKEGEDTPALAKREGKHG